MVKIHHGQVTVKNLEESIKFYEKLGLKLAGRVEQTVTQEGNLKNAKMKIALLQAGEDIFELIEYINPKSSNQNKLNPWDVGAQHTALQVEDITKFYTNFKSEINFLTPPVHYKTEGIDVIWT